jgi:5'(3')-deoxyribonucleotidase
MATIAIDMDDVLNTLMPTWLDAYNREYGDTRAVTDITNWDVWKHVKRECGQKIYDYHTPDLFLACAPMPGAQRVTQKLINDGHDLLVVSACWNPLNEAAKRQWLSEHFPWLNQDRCHFMLKGRAKCEHRADVLIDDGLHNFQGWPSGTIGLVFDQPWNQVQAGATYDIPLVRVFTWSHISDFFDRYNTDALLHSKGTFA